MMARPCRYCGAAYGAPDARGYCADCIRAHAGRACEARPGACEICDGA